MKKSKPNKGFNTMNIHSIEGYIVYNKIYLRKYKDAFTLYTFYDFAKDM